VIAYRSADDIQRAIPEVVLHLVRNGLIAYPTETVYGLGSTAAPVAVARLQQLKGRDPNKPFLLLVNGLAMLRAVGLRLTDTAERLAAAFWPGALTMVLPGGEDHLPPVLRGPEGGIAVRWTSYRPIAQLVEALGSPITSTSANRPRQPPALDGAEAAEAFSAAHLAKDLMVLDGGRLEPSQPSTLVDCTGMHPRVIRVGAIPPDRLRSIVPGIAGG